MPDFELSLPALALIVGVGLGLILVLTHGLWKRLPGWFKGLVFLALLAFVVLLALGKVPLP